MKSLEKLTKAYLLDEKLPLPKLYSKEYFNQLEIYLGEKQFPLVEKELKQLEKLQTRKGNIQINEEILSPIPFLKTLTNYLNIQEETTILKKYKRTIKRSIVYLKEHQDQTYLTFFKLNSKQNQLFKLEENLEFLSYCDKLGELCNQAEELNLADELFLIKGKIELGIQRYFYYSSTNTFINYFIPQTQEFSLSSALENAQYEKQCLFLEQKTKAQQIKTTKELYKKSLTLHEQLDSLLILKTLDPKFVEKELKTLLAILKYLPKDTLSKSQALNEQELQKSLFNEEISLKQFKKEKIWILEKKNLKTAQKIYFLLKDE